MHIIEAEIRSNLLNKLFGFTRVFPVLQLTQVVNLVIDWVRWGVGVFNVQPGSSARLAFDTSNQAIAARKVSGASPKGVLGAGATAVWDEVSWVKCCSSALS